MVAEYFVQPTFRKNCLPCVFIPELCLLSIPFSCATALSSSKHITPMDQLGPPIVDMAEGPAAAPRPSGSSPAERLSSPPFLSPRGASSVPGFSAVTSPARSSSRASGGFASDQVPSRPTVLRRGERAAVPPAMASDSPVLQRTVLGPFSRLRGHSRLQAQRRRISIVVGRRYLSRTGAGSRRADPRARSPGDRRVAAVSIRRRAERGESRRANRRPSRQNSQEGHPSVLAESWISSYNTSSEDVLEAWRGAAARRGWRVLGDRGPGESPEWTSLLSLAIIISFTCFPLLLIPQALSSDFPDFLLMIPPATSLFLVMGLSHPGINKFRLPLLLFALGPLVVVVATLADYRWLCQFVFVPLYGVLLFKWPRTCCFFFVALQLHLELVLVSCSITKLPYSDSQAWVVGVFFACIACPFPWCVFASAYSRLSSCSSCSPSSCLSFITFRISFLLLALCTLWSVSNSLLVSNLFVVLPSSSPHLSTHTASGADTTASRPAKDGPSTSPTTDGSWETGRPPGGDSGRSHLDSPHAVGTAVPRSACLLASAAGAAALMGVAMVLLWSSISKKLNWLHGGSFRLIVPHRAGSTTTADAAALQRGEERRRRRRRRVGERRRLSAETPELEFVVIAPLRDVDGDVYATRSGPLGESWEAEAPGDAEGDSDKERQIKSERLLRRLQAQQFEGRGWISTCSTAEFLGVDHEGSFASSPTSNASPSSSSASSSPTLPSSTCPPSSPPPSPTFPTSTRSPSSGVPVSRNSAVSPSSPPLPPCEKGLRGGTLASPSSSLPAACPTPMCTICQERLVSGAWVCELPPCKHIFHAKCLRRWLSERGTCPNCNLDLERALEVH